MARAAAEYKGRHDSPLAQLKVATSGSSLGVKDNSFPVISGGQVSLFSTSSLLKTSRGIRGTVSLINFQEGQRVTLGEVIALCQIDEARSLFGSPPYNLIQLHSDIWEKCHKSLFDHHCVTTVNDISKIDTGNEAV